MLRVLAVAAVAALALAESPLETADGSAQAPMRGMDRCVGDSLLHPDVSSLRFSAPSS
jgi:hypothetical protein